MEFKHILGEDFKKLHPKIQERYQHAFTTPFYASGVMKVMRTGPFFLRPLYRMLAKNNFIIPESGENIPFKIRTTPQQATNEFIDIQWERKFFFPKVTRAFHTTLRVSLKDKKATDYLGSPALASSRIHYHVTKDGALIHLSGKQHALLGALPVPLPAFLSGHGMVIDGYDDERDVHTIKAYIANDLIGEMMIYSGEFREEKQDNPLKK